jgi:hypothetical protein
VPVTILRVLAVYAVAAAGIMGFGSATERRYGVISTSVLVLLTLAFCLVLDIDRPNSGTVIVNQGPMLRTLATMRDSEAAKLVAPPSGPVQRP